MTFWAHGVTSVINNFRRETMKGHSNVSKAIALTCIILGYLFFLTSKFYMPESSEYFTPLLTTLSGNNRKYTLQEWVYAPTDNMMEIMIAIDNQAYDSIDTYNFGLYDSKKGYIQGEKYLEKRDMLVLRFYDVGKISSLSLRLTVDTTDHVDVIPEVVRFYNNINQIVQVDVIEDREPYEYYLIKIERQIELYQSDISDLQDEIDKEKKQIQAAQKTVEDLQASKNYKTEKETQKIDNQISTINGDINNMEYIIYEYQQEIQERKWQIENSLAEINDIKAANDVED